MCTCLLGVEAVGQAEVLTDTDKPSQQAHSHKDAQRTLGPLGWAAGQPAGQPRACGSPTWPAGIGGGTGRGLGGWNSPQSRGQPTPWPACAGPAWSRRCGAEAREAKRGAGCGNSARIPRAGPFSLCQLSEARHRRSETESEDAMSLCWGCLDCSPAMQRAARHTAVCVPPPQPPSRVQ